MEIMGAGGMFTMIAVAVVLFVLAGIKGKEYVEVRRKECSLSVEGAEYVRNERSSFKSSYGMLTSIGIGLCILSILNPIVFDKIPYVSSSLGAAMMFGFIGLGVFLITYAHTKMKGYDRLLELNVGMGEEFVPESDRKVNKLPIVICALIVGGVMITSMGTRFVLPFFSGTFFNDNGETIATTYSINEGESGMGISKGDINSININLNACKIIIEPAEGDGLVDVEYTGDKRLKPDVTFENGKLTAKNNASGGLNLGFNINKPVLTIKLGKETKIDNLEIKVNAGDISINGVYALKIDADAGNIDIRKTGLEDVTIDVDFGSVNINDLGSVDAYGYDCKVDAGIINIGGDGAGRKYKATGTGAGLIKINVDAGNIDIR